MFEYFSKANRAQRKIMAARREIIVDDAFHMGDDISTRISDQLARYALKPHPDVKELEFSFDDGAIYYNVEWVLQIKKEILITGLYCIVP